MMVHRPSKSAKAVAVAAAALVMVLKAGATPPCDPGAVTVRADRIASYMPFSEQSETINIRIDGSGDSACLVALRLSSGTGGDLLKDTGRLEVAIRTRQGRRLDVAGGHPVSITLLPTAGKGVSADLIAVLTPHQAVLAGMYEGRFELEVVSTDKHDQRAAFSLAALVASQADIRVAGRHGGGGQGVDFGILQSGLEESVLLSVRSNAGYAVELESSHGWALERAGGSRSDGRINYMTWFNDLLVPRDTVARLPDRYEPTGEAGKLNRLRFRIGDTSQKQAGQYQDTVRVTVVLLE